MLRPIFLLAIVIALSSHARAEAPTTQPLGQIGCDILKSIAPSEPFKLPDFDITYRLSKEPLPDLRAYTIVRGTTTRPGDLQNWRSFNFNGGTIWNRPAIFDSTLTAVKDRTTGKVFLYRDFANTVKIDVPPDTLRDQFYRFRHPATGLDLLDDRPKQK